VRTELTIEKEVYADAVVAEARIKAERIGVRDVELPADNVLDYYGLGRGEKEAIVLARALEDEIDFLVIDDKLGYIVCDRLEIRLRGSK
jgi:predicted nucleic acid-binding protein